MFWPARTNDGLRLGGNRAAFAPAGMSDSLHVFCVALLIISVVWPRYVFIKIGGFGLNPYTLGNLTALALCALALRARRALRVEWRWGMERAHPVAGLIAAFFAWRLVCDVLGETPSDSVLSTLRELFYVASPFVIGSVLFLDPRSRRALPLVLCACAALAAAVGLYERMEGGSIVSALGLANITAESDSVDRVATWGGVRDGGYRASAFFVHPILFGQFVSAVTPLALVLLWTRSAKARLVGLACLIATPLAIYAAGVRSPVFTALTSVGAFLSLLLWTRPGSTQVRAGAVVAALLVGVTLYFGAGDALSDMMRGRTRDEIVSSEARGEMIASGLAAIEESPVFGFGEGRSGLKAGMPGDDGDLSIDNAYLSLLLDFGYVGATLFIVLMGAIVRLGLRAARAAPPDDRAMAFALIGMTLGVLVGQSIVSIYENLSFIYMAAGCFTAMLAQPSPRFRFSA
ncbi:hypothetical protein M2322_002169 [Rhodoblastus acidophilus]|uniref:O-antigen ligase family protein n=1 Tax=Rhodoblastus acidophilus TaxID=1074 RepID=UPI0022252CA0|nr:O-antigen ligase family protein [Rhodoblastus acidophilus]MCW2316621.1 hypothetical protein [Rhodoblastus acidophilus]